MNDLEILLIKYLTLFIAIMYYILIFGGIIVDILTKECYYFTTKKQILYALFPFLFFYPITRNLINSLRYWWNELD